MKRIRRPRGSRSSVWESSRPSQNRSSQTSPPKLVSSPKTAPSIKQEHKRAKLAGHSAGSTDQIFMDRPVSPVTPSLTRRTTSIPRKASRPSSIWGKNDTSSARTARRIVRKNPVPSFSDDVHAETETQTMNQISASEREEPEKDHIEDDEEEPLEDGQLSAKQEHVISRVLQGDNVFITGSAGTGKSFVMREIIKRLNGSESRGFGVYVTASTGAAAVNVGGCTVHSFAGIGFGNGSVYNLKNRLLNNPMCTAAKTRWLNARVLIIDEVSMIDAGLFDKLEHLARLLRDSSEPFGGIQVVLCGDFFQLPPVRTKADTEEKKFMFQAACWNRVVHTTFVLDRLFRQKEDKPFAKILNEIRLGYVSPSGEKILEQCAVPFDLRPGSISANPCAAKEGTRTHTAKVIPTMLYSHRRDVDHENAMQLAALNGDQHSFYALDEGDNTLLKQLTAHCAAPLLLDLKLGAQVVLLKNMDFASGLVNGSRGVIVNFVMGKAPTPDNASIRDRIGSVKQEKDQDVALAPVVKFTNGLIRTIHQDRWRVALGKRSATRTQVPLALAWALSIHKAQGMTLSMVKMKLSTVWECGQAYVALSRATSQRGLYLIDYDVYKIRANYEVLRYYKDVLNRQVYAFRNMQK